LLDLSFRVQHRGDPESSRLIAECYWIPACAGMTK